MNNQPNNQPFSQEEKKDEFFVQSEQNAPTPDAGAPAQEAVPEAAAPDLALLKAHQQFKVARVNLLLVAVLTLLNVVLYFFSDFYMLFSANIPYLVTVFGDLLAMELALPVLTVMSVALSVVLTVPYFLGYFFSKKHHGWMIACLVYFSLDTVAMFLFLLVFGDIGGALLDVVFHAWVIYELFKGIRAGKTVKANEADSAIAE